METNLIQELRDTARRCNEAADILVGGKKPMGTAKPKRILSVAARKRIAHAQKVRWAKWKTKKAA